jgi:hypothetical protein
MKSASRSGEAKSSSTRVLALRPCAAPQASFELHQQALQRKEQSLHALDVGRQLQARAEALRRLVGLARIGHAAEEALEVERDPRPEAPRESLRGNRCGIAHPQEAEVGEPREDIGGPIEQEERQAGDAIGEIGELEAAAHRATLCVGASEEPRREGRRRNADAGAESQLARALANRRAKLRVPAEELEAR